MVNGPQIFQLFSETLPLAVEDRGTGQAFRILHGGAGPGAVAGLADAISKDTRAIVPTHPGFAGQARPSWFRRIDDLVLVYLALLDRLGISEVVVIGNSIGGWIAAEIALRHSPRIAAVVLLDSVGIDTRPGDPEIGNPMKLAPERRTALAFHDPQRFVLPQTPEAVAMMRSNQEALIGYGGEPYMHDPGLRSRLAEIQIPALLLSGEPATGLSMSSMAVVSPLAFLAVGSRSLPTLDTSLTLKS